jgi:hypothetical protein
MIRPSDDDKSFLELCRTKFNNINQRVRHRESYRAKNILNRFTFPEFVAFAKSNGLEKGKHCHRPNRDGDYSADNLEFITAQEHHAITGRERRKLSDQQIEEVIDKAKGTSLRKLGKQYGVSHVTIYRYIQLDKEKKEEDQFIERS